MKYLEEINKGMQLLYEDPKTIFVGQAVQVKGTALYWQVEKFAEKRKVEFPVCENVQASYCLGLSLGGFIPVCLFPRCNFAACAMDAISNHIDKWELMDNPAPHILIKMVVGSKFPLNPGPQHQADLTECFRYACPNIEVVSLLYPQDVFPTYRRFLEEKKPMIIVEHGDFY